jgi:two-component system sensor histidine kinase KdpD
VPDGKSGPIIVALGYGPEGQDLVRAGKALAGETGLELECLTVDTGRRPRREEGEALAEAQRLARGLGAKLTSVPAIDAAEGIAKAAAERGSGTIVVGRGRPRLLARSMADRLLAGRGSTTVVTLGRSRSTVQARASAQGRARFGEGFGEGLGHYAAAIVIIAAVTGLNLALADYAGYWAAAITYLAAISLTALVLDRWPVLLAALLSALAWDFFFIPPRFTLSISRTEDVLMLGLYLLVALCSGWLTGRLRASERLLAAREARLSRLSSLASALAGASVLGSMVQTSARAIEEAFGVECVLMLRDAGGSLKQRPEGGWEPLDENAKEAARLAFEEGKAAGRFSPLAPRSEWHFVPLEEASERLGVIGLRAAGDASWWGEEAESFLRTIAYTVASAIAREWPEPKAG